MPLIIVGIYNTGKSRIHEYTPTKAPKLGGGRADRYAKFLLQEVMPFIQNEYRADPNPRLTGIGGSSLGGLVSLYLGLKLPHSFGKIAALSPSVWWNQRVILRFAATARVDPHPSIWLDIGTKEGPRIVSDVEQFRDVLIQKGWSLGQDLHYERIEGGEHNEWAWSQRIGRVLEFLYPARIVLDLVVSLRHLVPNAGPPTNDPLRQHLRKGHTEFFRTCKQMGWRVLLLTVEKLRGGDWPAKPSANFSVPEDILLEHLIYTVSYMACIQHIDPHRRAR